MAINEIHFSEVEEDFWTRYEEVFEFSRFGKFFLGECQGVALLLRGDT